jgi:hypothetical protein
MPFLITAFTFLYAISITESLLVLQERNNVFKGSAILSDFSGEKNTYRHVEDKVSYDPN